MASPPPVISLILYRFIYNVATNTAGAKLSVNQCLSLFTHGISSCVMVGLKKEALQWWIDNDNLIPNNAIIFDATHLYRLTYSWNLREHSKQALERYWLPDGIKFDSHRHNQAIIMARTFLFVDMLHQGVNVWMIDSDVVFPMDPRGIFLDPKFDCVYMMNIGDFTQDPRNEYPYSYPFLADGRHATINNGVVAARATPSSLKLWEISVDRILNHIHGDPQHPHNQLLFLYGLNLKKEHLEGYPDQGDLGYYKGNVMIYANESDSLPLTIRTVSSSSPYGDGRGGTHSDLQQQVAVHAVGLGGMYARQGMKCEYFKNIGFWYIANEDSCD